MIRISMAENIPTPPLGGILTTLANKYPAAMRPMAVRYEMSGEPLLLNLKATAPGTARITWVTKTPIVEESIEAVSYTHLTLPTTERV